MRKALSLLFAVVILLSCLAGMTCTVSAAESEVPAYANTNLALNAPVSTYLDECVEQWGNAVRHLTDGDRSTMFLSSMVQPVESVEYDWIMVDLGEERIINQVTLVAHYDPNLNRYYMFPTDYALQISTDNENWTTVAECRDFACDRFTVVHDFDAQPARYVRIYVTGVDTSVHNPPYWFVYLTEFEVTYFSDTREEYKGKAENVLTDPAGVTEWTINSESGPVDYRTYVNYAFDAFCFDVSVKIPGTQDIRFELYKWDTSLEKTLSGKNLLRGQTFTALESGKTYKVEFDTPMPAGEYLFSIMDVTDHTDACLLGMYRGSDGTTNTTGECYVRERLRADFVPSLTVYTSDESYVEGTMFGKAPETDPPTGDTAPEETTAEETAGEEATAAGSAAATEAPATEAASTADEETTSAGGGCGSAVSISAMAIVAAMGAAFVLKKKH